MRYSTIRPRWLYFEGEDQDYGGLTSPVISTPKRLEGFHSPRPAAMQAEGEGLSRKNGELEATVRKLRAAVRDAEQERERYQGRTNALESQLAQQQERSTYSVQSAAQQVIHIPSREGSRPHISFFRQKAGFWRSRDKSSLSVGE